ncbi:MAG: protein TolA, partial [Rhodoferax sp.]|nr:protein TolA [Rhodoferax sp.]
MRAAAQRFEFAPPPTAGLPKSLGLAILAHALLLAALTWGISWKRDAPMVVAEAELWSAVPQQAAPKLVEPPPAPPPVLAPPKKAAPVIPDASIALEREKQRLKK